MGRGTISESHTAPGRVGLGRGAVGPGQRIPLFFLELGNSILTWVTCSKEGFGYCRLCVIM